MNRLAYPIVILGATMAGCADPVDPPLDPVKDRPLDPPIELSINLVRGNAQEAPPGTELPAPLEVHVRNQNHGSADGARVSWFVEAGTGTFRPSGSVETTVGGAASVYFTPLSAGAIVAAVAGNDTTRFTVLPPALAVYGDLANGFRFFVDSVVVAVQDGYRYLGRFSRGGATLWFDIIGRSARGTLYPDSLEIDYDAMAEFDGFVDGGFRLDRVASAAADAFLDGIDVRTDQAIGQVLGPRTRGSSSRRKCSRCSPRCSPRTSGRASTGHAR